jgi:hypothetical protein
MRIPALLVMIAIAIPSTLPGQSGTCSGPFEAAVAPGGEIAMDLRSGDITIVGGDTPVLRVSCTKGRSGDASEVRISFAARHLTIRGGGHGDVRFRIEVPRMTNLRIRASAGDLNLSGVTGNKDVGLRAGDLTIAVGRAEDYRHVEASVMAGDLRASAFGVSKDGLFRSFSQDNPAGRYRLHAELLAGDLTLE